MCLHPGQVYCASTCSRGEGATLLPSICLLRVYQGTSVKLIAEARPTMPWPTFSCVCHERAFSAPSIESCRSWRNPTRLTQWYTSSVNLPVLPIPSSVSDQQACSAPVTSGDAGREKGVGVFLSSGPTIAVSRTHAACFRRRGTSDTH